MGDGKRECQNVYSMKLPTENGINFGCKRRCRPTLETYSVWCGRFLHKHPLSACIHINPSLEKCVCVTFSSSCFFVWLFNRCWHWHLLKVLNRSKLWSRNLNSFHVYVVFFGGAVQLNPSGNRLSLPSTFFTVMCFEHLQHVKWFMSQMWIDYELNGEPNFSLTSTVLKGFFLSSPSVRLHNAQMVFKELISYYIL